MTLVGKGGSGYFSVEGPSPLSKIVSLLNSPAPESMTSPKQANKRTDTACITNPFNESHQIGCDKSETNYILQEKRSSDSSSYPNCFNITLTERPHHLTDVGYCSGNVHGAEGVRNASGQGDSTKGRP